MVFSSTCILLVVLTVFLGSLSISVMAFTSPPLASFAARSQSMKSSSPPSMLFAKKKAKRSKTASTVSMGFGGAAVESCTCGSGNPYKDCCGLLHSSPDAYAKASASQVVRARYSAYAKRVVDFIVDTTHPENPSVVEDIGHWKDTIAKNCYDDFELTKCAILEESYKGEGPSEVGTVRFEAHIRQRNTKEESAFVETSTFERHPESGAWLYKLGDVDKIDP